MSVLTPPPPTPAAPPPTEPPSSSGAPGGRPSSLWLSVGAIITGLLIIAGAMNLFALTAGHDTRSSQSSFAVGSTTAVLPALTVAASSADITLVPGDAGTVVVDQRAHVPHGGSVDAPTLSGMTLHLPGHCHGSGLGWLISCGVSYVVHVPATTQLTVETGSGDVAARGGDFTTLTLRLGSGDLDLTDLTATTVTASTGSGDIDLTGAISGPVKVKTGSGDVHVAFAQDATALTATTGSGDLDIAVPPDGVAYVVHASTGSGDLNNQLRTTDDTTGTTAVGVLTAKTGSGDLTLRYSR